VQLVPEDFDEPISHVIAFHVDDCLTNSTMDPSICHVIELGISLRQKTKVKISRLQNIDSGAGLPYRYLLETGFNRNYARYTVSMMRFSYHGGERLGSYLKQSQSAEYVLPSSKKALINDRLDNICRHSRRGQD
jgi:hypothetical protein